MGSLAQFVDAETAAEVESKRKGKTVNESYGADTRTVKAVKSDVF